MELRRPRRADHRYDQDPARQFEVERSRWRDEGHGREDDGAPALFHCQSGLRTEPCAQFDNQQKVRAAGLATYLGTNLAPAANGQTDVGRAQEARGVHDAIQPRPALTRPQMLAKFQAAHPEMDFSNAKMS